jgi:hypothetical protein
MRRNEKGLTLSPARGGWVHVTLAEDDQLIVLLRFDVVPGGDPRTVRLGVVQAVVMVGGPDPRQVDVATWRSVPIAEATTLANLPEYRSVILEHLNDAGAELGIGEGIGDTQPVLTVKRTGHAYKLPKPTGTRFPDSFYKRVADAFETAVTAGRPPGRTIAEANKVPETTVARWIREARRRELLAPAGGKGRIG